MRGLVTVFKKEFRENMRDRRTIMSSLLIGPIAGPFLFVMMMMLITSKQVERAESVLELPVFGAENAPNLIAFLEQQGTIIKSAPEDPESAVRAKDEDVIVRIPPNFAEHWQAGQPAPVEIIVDKSRNQVGTTLARVRHLLSSYGQQIGLLRLQLRGVSPSLTTPLVLKDIDLSTPTSRAGQLLALLPYFLILTAFIGGMHLAIDTTAGEKERRSLEPLLITPVPRWQIMAGKLATTTLFAFFSLTLTLVAFRFAMPMIPADRLGFVIDITPRMMGSILLVLAPMALTAAALLTILASFAKSFREAQSYMGLVVFVPLIPSLYLLASPVKAQTWQMAVPLLSHNVLINELVRGETVPLSWIGLCVATTLGLGVILATIAATLYNKPRLVFAGS